MSHFPFFFNIFKYNNIHAMAFCIDICAFPFKYTTFETKLMISCLTILRHLQQSSQRSVKGNSVTQVIQTESFGDYNFILNLTANPDDFTFKVNQDANHFLVCPQRPP